MVSMLRRVKPYKVHSLNQSLGGCSYSNSHVISMISPAIDCIGSKGVHVSGEIISIESEIETYRNQTNYQWTRQFITIAAQPTEIKHKNENSSSLCKRSDYHVFQNHYIDYSQAIYQPCSTHSVSYVQNADFRNSNSNSSSSSSSDSNNSNCSNNTGDDSSDINFYINDNYSKNSIGSAYRKRYSGSSSSSSSSYSRSHSNNLLRPNIHNNYRTKKKNMTNYFKERSGIKNFKYFSTNAVTNNENNTTKLLLRHFLLQIHPDYFLQFKSEQEVNNRNYGILQEICADFNPYEGHKKENVRSLTFFLKPSEKNPTPRRVKISIGSRQRVELSIIDVLETLGVTVPASTYNPEDKTVRSSVHTTKSNAVEMKNFLDTLIDRKELMSWRFERSAGLTRLLDIVIKTFGVDNIDIRYSWSAQNNSILLSSLLRLIEPRYAEFGFPWTGLSLVLCFDDCSQIPVDGVEGHVMINPSHVPVQWLNIFLKAGHPSVLLAAASGRSEIEKYEKLFEIAAASQLKFAIRNLVAKTLIEKGDLEKPKFSLDGLSVRIRKGHTCSRTWYLHFFHNMEVAMNKINFVNALLDEEKNKENDKEIANAYANDKEDKNENTLKKNNYYLPAIKSKNIFLFEKTEEKKIKSYMDKFSFLQYLPLEIDIVVEEGHGTKLLQSGELRADCRCSAIKIDDLIKTKCLDSLKLSAENKILKNNIEELRESVIEKFSLISVEAGVGVDLIMMQSFLSRLNSYEYKENENENGNRNENKSMSDHNQNSNKKTNLGKFRNIGGMRVVVGKYLGLDDQGKCILPWDWSI